MISLRFVCLLLLYILATSKVISGRGQFNDLEYHVNGVIWVIVRDSVEVVSWRGLTVYTVMDVNACACNIPYKDTTCCIIYYASLI